MQPSPAFSSYNASLVVPDVLASPSWRKSAVYNSVLWTQTVLEPFIVVLGIIGNLLATLTLLSPRLRTTSCCLYLAAKCLGDSVFLLALSVVWLYRVDAPQLFNTQGVCQLPFRQNFWDVVFFCQCATTSYRTGRTFGMLSFFANAPQLATVQAELLGCFFVNAPQLATVQAELLGCFFCQCSTTSYRSATVQAELLGCFFVNAPQLATVLNIQGVCQRVCQTTLSRNCWGILGCLQSIRIQRFAKAAYPKGRCPLRHGSL
ncbi:hypothetical protein RRG08_037552 [Elysia crispata]|uniref:G-protein coupled receptors family 1 profile domain-containing protein n=1 Tax=Elysia crispata TaxID=231223 RepID=A0AAE1CTB7_9GAST|nr:hypothetical protein RRG08_037552 [Elysia crispata]